MPAQWYYAKQGRQLGPIPAEQLRQMATGGQLQPTDLVWTEGMAEWTQAGRVREIYPEAARAAAKAAPSPGAGTAPPAAGDSAVIAPSAASPAADRSRGLLELLDLKFQHYVAPSIVKLVWVIYLAMLGIGFVVQLGYIFWTMSVRWALLAVPLLVVSTVVGALLVRLGLELTLVVFRIAEYLRQIRERLPEPDAASKSSPPGR